MIGLPGTGASSARLYWESFRTAFAPTVLDLPVGCSIFPKEIIPAARRWAEKYYRNLIYWNKLERGGHFVAPLQGRSVGVEVGLSLGASARGQGTTVQVLVEA